MKNKRLKLPVGIQRFEEIREGGYIYVDKTEYLVEMIQNGKIYFLARPRRFGKSVIVSTFEAIFGGEKKLFKGLYAEEFTKDFKPSPVIRLDMSGVVTDSGIDVIRESMVYLVKKIAEKLDVLLSESNVPGILFNNLISTAYKKYNKKVVVLIDEYDAPYTDFVNKPDIAAEVRDVLRGFYKQLKANEEYIRFLFITGISKFAKLGVFSTLNNPKDISLTPDYSDICGYTESEIIRYFPEYLEETAREMKITTDALIEKMRYYYNGFTFDRNCSTKLYNPFSTLNFFGEKSFDNFWIETGQSLFLSEYLKNRNLTVEQFRNFPISRVFAKSPGEVDKTSPEGFLHQAGYLTLRPGTNGSDLSLDYPNTEVLNSMSNLLTQNIIKQNYNIFESKLLSAIVSNDVKKFIECANHILSCIPYEDFKNAAKQSVELTGNKLTVQEWLYRSCIIAFLRGWALLH
ncbi:MAG: AAA family ATPase, partial [Marinilabiliaceae bacterium]|nr:AAA family ATPase [Marinilabiliaceae bacterium]